jgi:arylsulfatase A-like enzyme
MSVLIKKNIGVVFLLFVFCISAQNKPNIILFLVDDMGVMDTSVPFLLDTNRNPEKHALNNWYRTPNMERLAKLGTRFSTFYAQSVCSPSRISILTGQNSARHRTTQWIKPESDNKGEFGPKDWNWKGLKISNTATLPKLLQANGYETIYIGKAHLGPENYEGENPLNLGFNYNIGGTSKGSPGSYLGTDNYDRMKKDVDYQVPHLETYHGTDTFLTEALTLEANKKIIEAVKAEKPFFLEMAHYAVHSPFVFDERFKTNYTSEEYPEDAKKFATLIEGMDKSLGDIMDQLEASGIAENTLILFFGDNGSDAPLGNFHDVACASPIRGKKGTHYEGGTRVPFIGAWAKSNKNNIWQKKLPIVEGAIEKRAIGTIMDFYPTVLELLNINKPKSHVLDGHSLRKSLIGKSKNRNQTEVLMHFPHEHRSSYFTSFRKGNWKLIYHYYPELNPSKTKYELYNLSIDPYEQTNLADNEFVKLKIMLKQMNSKLESQNALYPVDSNGNELKPF